MTYDEWKLTSPYEEQPKPIDDGDLADMAFEQSQ